MFPKQFLLTNTKNEEKGEKHKIIKGEKQKYTKYTFADMHSL